MTERNRRLLWLVAVIVAFILGFLLGMRYCRKERSGGEGGGVVMGGHGGGGPGAAAHITPGTGGGNVKGGGGYLKIPVDTDSSGGGGQVAGGGGGDAGGGNGGGDATIRGDSGEYQKKHKPVDTLSTGFVAQLAEDQLTGHSPKEPPPPPDPRITTKTADDFSLDQTALPRYPMDVTRAFSAVSPKSDAPADTGTGAAFATSDSYDSVSSWYRHHMPAGSHAIDIDANKLKAMVKQLTPQNIMKMFTSSTDSQKTLDTTGVDSTGPGTKLSGWEIPDDGVHGKRSVTVLSAPGKPTTVIMSRSRRP